MRQHFRILAITLVAFIFNSSIRAQEAGISTSASENISLKPQRIRLTMWVKAQGIDLKSALKSLNEHKARVQKDLVIMKADEASIVFSASRLSEGTGAQDPNAARYQQIVIRQLRASGGNVKMPPVFTATAALKAEWTLPVQEGDALAILPASLKQQIVARDIAGENNKPELDENQQEQLAELKAQMEEQYGGYSGSDDSEQGPSIVFVADATDEQIQAATKAAFEAAVRKAESLVEAIGLKLGELRSVSRTTSNSEDYRLQAAYYGSLYGNSQIPSSLSETTESTISGQSVDELFLPVTVAVSYAIAN